MKFLVLSAEKFDFTLTFHGDFKFNFPLVVNDGDISLSSETSLSHHTLSGGGGMERRGGEQWQKSRNKKKEGEEKKEV